MCSLVRRPGVSALVFSVAVHAGLVLWLATRASPSRQPAIRSPEEVLVVELVEAAPRPAPTRLPVPMAPPKTKLRPSPQRREASSPMAGHPDQASVAALSSSPLGTDVAPEALRRVRVRPPAGKKPVRAVWQVEGWLRRRMGTAEQLARAFGATAYGLPVSPFVDQLVAPGTADAQLEYRARLRAIY